jgi:tRNA(fMet)-specific endonuclease VapC
MIFLDTDHLSVVVNRRAAGHASLMDRLDNARDSLSVPVICVEEQCKGWLAKIHHTRDVHQQILAYEHLKLLFHFFRKWEIRSFDTAAASAFNELRRQKIRIGSQDLKIAGMTLTSHALLLSANLRDFQKVPGLRVENGLQE